MNLSNLQKERLKKELSKMKQFKFVKYKKIIAFLFMLTFLSFGKNIIHSGCLVYPVYQTCFKSKNLSWSYGKDLSEKRLNFLTVVIS